jgi:uncharacterized membrane protein
MNSNKKTAVIVGILFLTAMVTSLVGGFWLESLISAPDYLDSLSTNKTQVIFGVLLELINCIAVVGIASMMYPIFKPHNESLALGYFGFRVIEAVILVAAVISPLLLVTLSREFINASTSEASYYHSLGNLFIAARAQLAGLLVPVFFSLAALIFYYLLYQSILVPRFLSVWGLIAVVLLFGWNLLENFGIHISIGMVLALPMILNEITLGIWLIVKGFNPPAMDSRNTSQV